MLGVAEELRMLGTAPHQRQSPICRVDFCPAVRLRPCLLPVRAILPLEDTLAHKHQCGASFRAEHTAYAPQAGIRLFQKIFCSSRTRFLDRSSMFPGMFFGVKAT